MPFKGSRGPLIIGVIIFVLLITVIAVAASNGSTKKPKTAGLAVVTVNADIGIDYVQIVNMRTGGQNIKSSMDLPYSFNCTEGDVIKLFCTTMHGFVFNTWEFNIGVPFLDDNPLTIRVNNDITVTGKVLIDVGGNE